MGKIVKFFLNRPILVNLIVILIVGLGIKSAYKAQKEGFPKISLNRIIIQTIYPGSSARDVEVNVTVPIENQLSEVEGIKEVTSVSEEGISRIEVEANNDATSQEFQKLYADVDNALMGIDDLPKDIDGKPTLNEFTSKDIPVMEIAFSGHYKLLKTYIDYLESKIKKINGVACVDVIGLPDEEVQIMVDPVRARKYSVDLRAISTAIKKRNLEGSGGTLESFTDEKKVVFLSKFKNFSDVLNTNIIMNPDGYGVKLKDIASIKVMPKDMNLIVRNNGKRGAVLSIRKTGSSDLIKVINEINILLNSEILPSGIERRTLLDQSNLTRDRIRLLVGNAFIGFVLVTILLLAIFDIKTAFWTAFGIPFTLLGILIFLKNTGISLNLISLGGFIIIIGMLVDDAIVISEEINSNKEKGLPPKQAAIDAVKKMWIPVTGGCLTTVIAFSPIFSIGGFPGKFVWTIPLMVIIGLCISLFESFFILPAHLYHGKAHPQGKKKFIIALENIYKKTLTKAINYKYIVLFISIVIFLISVYSMNTFVNKDPFPQEAAEGFNIKITLPKGSFKNTTEKKIKQIEDILLKLPQDELVGISSRIGTQSELSATQRGTQNNIAIIFVYLKPFSGRTRTADQIMNDLNAKISNVFKNIKSEYSFNLKRIGPPMGKPFEIRIISNNDSIRYNKTKDILKFLNTINGISDIETNEVEGKDELDITLNYDMLSRTQLTVEDILITLRIAFDGQVVTDMVSLNKKIDFRLRLNNKKIRDINFIKNLPILNKRGNLINLNTFVAINKQPSKAKFHHIDGKRSITIYGNTDIDKINPLDVMNLVKKKFRGDEKVTISFSGQPMETLQIFGNLVSSALTALIGVFLLITLILNSFSKPIIIMAPLPFLIVGVAFALITHNLPMSMLAGIAIIGLLGVVVNDSIVMIHSIHNMAVDKKITKDIVIAGAVSRLRPIVLTTITTICGVLPTGYGLGGYDPFLSQMCIVLAYGLLFSTIMILFMVPILYNVGFDISKLMEKIKAT